CVDQMAGRACNLIALAQTMGTIVSASPECKSTFVGKVTAGHACSAIPDFAAGTHCVFPALQITSDPLDPLNGLFGDQTSLGGTCVGVHGAGQICNASRHRHCGAR